MSKKPLSRGDQKRLEQLQKSLEIKENKLNAQEIKLKKLQKELEKDQRTLATDKKQFLNEKKQFKNDKDSNKSSSKLSRPRSTDRPFSASKSKKLKEDYESLKKKHEHFAKLMRDYKKKADQLDAENKVLRKRVGNQNNKKLPTNDKQLRGLMKENRWLKKKLRQLLKDLAKQKRWYARVVKVFKDNNNKWVQKKIEAYKDKEYIIKYVFLDDIKRIVLTRPGYDRNGFKPRIRIKNGHGGQIVLRNVGIDVFDQKIRKIDNKGKRDRKGNGGSNNKRHSKDIITKQRPGKDGKNIIKTKYIDTGDIESVTKEKAQKKGNKSGTKNATPTVDDNAKSNTKKGNKNSATDPATSEFLKSDPQPSTSTNDDSNNDNNDNNDNTIANGKLDDTTFEDNDGKEMNDEEWETVADPEDDLDDYLIEFLNDLGMKVSKDDLDNIDEKLAEYGDNDNDDDEDAKLDKEFANALKTDKDLMFDGESNGSPEMEAQMMYLIGEMDNRNDDLRQLKDIWNGVQYISKADSGGNEEDMEEKELKTSKDKLDAMELVFANMQKRQETFIENLEGLNSDTDALREINNSWYEEYHTIAKMAMTGGGEGSENSQKHFEKLRYFIDYFMKELIGRMYDLRCVNAAYYNEGMEAVAKSANEEINENKDDESNENNDKPVFERLQNGIDERHTDITDTVQKDEVMNNDNSNNDKVSNDIEQVLNDFISNMDDWKSLIEETKQKHEKWIETRGNLYNSLLIRHNEIGEIMNKINNVPSYSMNLQKYLPNEDENDNDNDNENENDDNASNNENNENDNENPIINNENENENNEDA